MLISCPTVKVVHIVPAGCSPKISYSLPTADFNIYLSHGGSEASRLCLEVDGAWRESREVSIYRDRVECAIGTS
jgi:hypothetical protein